MKALIYNGDGAGALSIGQAQAALKAILPEQSQIGCIDAHTLCRGLWCSDTDLLVMPGGRDLPYCESLNGLGTGVIRDFVNTGGSYVGFCAGAYFATSKVIFDQGGALEVIGDRDLQLFSGHAIGPAFGVGTYTYTEEESARVVIVKTSSGKRFHLYYNGGCYFANGLPEEATVLAVFDELPGKPAAVVHRKYGAGHVLLSGVHPEFSAKSLIGVRNDLSVILSEHETERLEFLKSIFSFLLK